MSRIVFSKSRPRYSYTEAKAAKEVTISLTKSSAKDARCGSVYLRNGAEKKLAADCGHIRVEIDPDLGRMYLVPADRLTGYKLGKSQNSIVPTVCAGILVRGADIAVWEPFVGDFDLFYDKSEKLWYIDATLKA